MEEEGVIRFSEHLIMDGFGYAYGLAAADLNGDGHVDITAADADGCALYWFQNDGRGTFTRRWIQRDHPKPRLERHAVGDINGDGLPDAVIVANLTGDLYWFENGGRPANGELWTLHAITIGGMPYAYDVALGDLNGNGMLDVAASGWKASQVAWFENPGSPNGEWVKHLLDADMTEARTIRVADFNGNGDPDLLATGTDANLVVWYENPGAGATTRWHRHVIDDSSVRPAHGHPVDMDGDGDVEVVATAWGDEGGLYLFKHEGDPRGPWQRQVLKSNWRRANQVVVADLNGDGHLDIVAGAERGSNELR